MPVHILNSSVAGGNTFSTNYSMAHDFGISPEGNANANGYLRPEAALARLGHILSG
jgi:hypothetical protein